MRRREPQTSPGPFYARHRSPELNDVWITEELKTLRAELMFRRNLREVAATLGRSVAEVEEMAHDLGWITSPPFIPDESKCGD